MKSCTIVSVFSLVLLSSSAALAQDAAKVDSAHYKVLLENPSVRVLKVTYPIGDKSVMHQHPDTMVIPLVTSNVRFTTPDGKTQDMELAAETVTYTPAGTHRPENIGKAAVDALLVEFKTAAPGTAAIPSSRDNLAMKVLADSPRAIAYRVTADAAFQEPAGSKHEYDQIVITLGAGQMSLSVDGQPAKTNWERGDAQFIPRGVAHASKNAGGKPIDFIIVAIK
jgi:beta-alanine degradation protein BauB